MEAIDIASEVKTVLFALECLIDLVQAKGSVLSMWALDPPLFSLLTSNGGLADENFAVKQPRTHLAVLQMLLKHCQIHHQFLASSRLLTSTTGMTGPTSDYFSQILTLIMDMQEKNLAPDLLTNWIVSILTISRKNIGELLQGDHFNSFLRAALKSRQSAILQSLLLSEGENSLLCEAGKARPQLLELVYANLCEKLHENDPVERKVVLELWHKLPPLCVDWAKNSSAEKPDKKTSSQLMTQQAEKEGHEKAKLRASDFKKLCDILITVKGKTFLFITLFRPLD